MVTLLFKNKNKNPGGTGYSYTKYWTYIVILRAEDNMISQNAYCTRHELIYQIKFMNINFSEASRLEVR
jgi:hypothetical protein